MVLYIVQLLETFACFLLLFVFYRVVKSKSLMTLVSSASDSSTSRCTNPVFVIHDEYFVDEATQCNVFWTRPRSGRRWMVWCGVVCSTLSSSFGRGWRSLSLVLLRSYSSPSATVLSWRRLFDDVTRCLCDSRQSHNTTSTWSNCRPCVSPLQRCSSSAHCPVFSCSSENPTGTSQKEKTRRIRSFHRTLLN